MGGYAPFVWPAYIIAFSVLMGFLIASIREHRLSERKFFRAKEKFLESRSEETAPLP